MNRSEKKLVTVNAKQFAIVVLAAIVMLACQSRAPTSQTRGPQSPPQTSPPQKGSSPESPGQVNAADAGRGLRQMALTTPPKDMDIKPSAAFPRVYGVLMDFPVNQEVTATVFSLSDGTSSLYTTSTFGILGGGGHASVRAAAMKFVKAADRFHDAATPTKEYPYPASDRVRFYLLTFDGVRVVDTDFAAINNGTSKYRELFGLGQDVLTELRQLSEKTP
ncbi:MAG TPA: hypothetical protein VGN90_07205 [Pyrinomonadaceae bacterium]|jgi:hypothetical protein|nr:hypothetical protein [Pyrinomonadaceae bacterium]